MGKTKVSPPWITYGRKIIALFGDDPEIEVSQSYDDGNWRIELMVFGNSNKASAIRRLLPEEKEFGNVSVKVVVAEKPVTDVETKWDMMFNAFSGNPMVKRVVQSDTIFSNPMVYVVFDHKIAQFFNDNIGDPEGLESMLYQDIAKELFDEPGVFYCTAPETEEE